MRLALAQFQSHPGDKTRQLEQLRAEAHRLRGQVDLLVTPELFMTGYRLPTAEIKALAEPADGPFAADMAALARETGIALLYGYPERAEGTVFNAVQVFGADGDRVAGYRKLHLPSDDERAAFTLGNRFVTFSYLGFRVAPLICYDVEFPEMVRAAAIAGADLVIAPTALRRQWSMIAEKLIPVRALESGLFVAYANWAGAEADWDYAGLSVIAAPDGQELARAGDAPQTVIATLDRNAVAAARARLPYLKDARMRLSGLL
ncbi:carbon-nitrogen hydrolase family protein [Dongia sp.]|uniref:carbon-nitrogen hydrolase family protein n=1 Tax=Dongia sp. TaxID=1977262 RepID=UPI0035B3B63F